jgi:hypothetical protein
MTLILFDFLFTDTASPSKRQVSASGLPFHVERHPACPCECRRSALNFLVFASYLKLQHLRYWPAQLSSYRARVDGKPLRNRAVYGLRPSARKGGKTLASTVKISMLQPETASLALDTHVRIGRRPEIQENSFESHRQFYPQGQYH